MLPSFIEAIKLVRQVPMQSSDIYEYASGPCPCCGQERKGAGLSLVAAKRICDKLRENGVVFKTYDE